MRDHATEELISAYVDGELEGDELKRVEVLLAESAECRQLLAEFQGLRASLWSLPRQNLPADFSERVVREIDERAVATRRKQLERGGRTRRMAPWRSVFVAAASLAAVVVLAMMLRPPGPMPHLPEPPDGLLSPVVMPVYFRQEPKYVMVYDVTVTPAGKEGKVIEATLKKLGIGIDPALRLDDALEKELMVIRESGQQRGQTEASPYKDDPAAPKREQRDQVEMLYVASTIGVLDQFGRKLEEMRGVGTQVSHLHYDLAIEPNKLGVMHRLHDAAREHFAHSDVVPSDVGQAFRLSFRFELASVSGPGTAAFPVLTIAPESLLAATTSVSAEANRDARGGVDGLTAADATDVISQLNELDPEVSQDAVARAAEAGPQVDWGKEPGHILLIIRNVGANAQAGK